MHEAAAVSELSVPGASFSRKPRLERKWKFRCGCSFAQKSLVVDRRAGTLVLKAGREDYLPMKMKGRAALFSILGP